MYRRTEESCPHKRPSAFSSVRRFGWSDMRPVVNAHSVSLDLSYCSSYDSDYGGPDRRLSSMIVSPPWAAMLPSGSVAGHPHQRQPTGCRSTCALARSPGGCIAGLPPCLYRAGSRYGRIAAVFRAGGEDLNGWMVSEGLALAYRRYSTAWATRRSLSDLRQCGGNSLAGTG